MLLNASGCYSTTIEQLEELNQNQYCYGIVSKSATLLPQSGHPHPRLYIDEDCCINSIGLENKGLEYYNNIKTNKLYVQSLYTDNLDNIEQLLKNVKSEVIEFNLSCPNLSSLNFKEYLDTINKYRSDKIIGIKMPPLLYKNDIINYSNLLNKYKIDFITCCNNIPNCLVIEDNQTVIYPNSGLGGMSFKHLALGNVYQFYQHFNGIIIGCGGVKTGKDVYEYVLVGVSYIQIGSTLLREGPNCFERINKEFQFLLNQRGYTSYNDIKGKLKIKSKL